MSRYDKCLAYMARDMLLQISENRYEDLLDGLAIHSERVIQEEYMVEGLTSSEAFRYLDRHKFQSCGYEHGTYMLVRPIEKGHKGVVGLDIVRITTYDVRKFLVKQVTYCSSKGMSKRQKDDKNIMAYALQSFFSDVKVRKL